MVHMDFRLVYGVTARMKINGKKKRQEDKPIKHTFL